VALYEVRGGQNGTGAEFLFLRVFLANQQGPDFDDMSSFFLYVVNVAFKY
jgi:hypothetical protein